MITKFKLFENIDLIKNIQSVLTPDLLKGQWNRNNSNPVAGHCYAATEALYWLFDGPNGNWNTYVLNNKNFPDGLAEGETHWFLKNKKTNEILDPTAEQFDATVPYENGKQNSMMNYPKSGSKRAREIMRRIKIK